MEEFFWFKLVSRHCQWWVTFKLLFLFLSYIKVWEWIQERVELLVLQTNIKTLIRSDLSCQVLAFNSFHWFLPWPYNVMCSKIWITYEQYLPIFIFILAYNLGTIHQWLVNSTNCVKFKWNIPIWNFHKNALIRTRTWVRRWWMNTNVTDVTNQLVNGSRYDSASPSPSCEPLCYVCFTTQGMCECTKLAADVVAYTLPEASPPKNLSNARFL